jgi:hypothetical protein
MRANLDAIVATLGESRSSQPKGRFNAIGATAKTRALRLALRFNHMRRIASVASFPLKVR